MPSNARLALVCGGTNPGFARRRTPRAPRKRRWVHNSEPKGPLAVMGVVWQKFHILSRAQVFVVASMCAVVIALAVALASIPADGTSWNRFLGPSRQLDPFINFGSAFVSVLPVFLGYYHLARLGAFLGAAISALTCFATQVSAGFHLRLPSGRSLSNVAGGYVCRCVDAARCAPLMGTHQDIQF
jgi:hypothetical protein